LLNRLIIYLNHLNYVKSTFCPTM